MRPTVSAAPGRATGENSSARRNHAVRPGPALRDQGPARRDRACRGAASSPPVPRLAASWPPVSPWDASLATVSPFGCVRGSRAAPGWAGIRRVCAPASRVAAAPGRGSGIPPATARTSRAGVAVAPGRNHVPGDLTRAHRPAPHPRPRPASCPLHCDRDRGGASGRSPTASAGRPVGSRGRGRAAWLQAHCRTAGSGALRAIVGHSYLLRMLVVVH